jgi:hypothetical protein
MINLLTNIIEVLGNLPLYIMYAIETIANLFFGAIQGIFELATSLISLPAVPAVPEFISAINWFYPIGAVITVLVPLVTAFISFLGIRYILKWTGNL